MKTPLKLDQLESWCQDLVQNFSSKQIVLLSGPLGAGKTELVKYMLQALGGEVASSPTFSLINSYEVPGKKVYHIDLYRIEGEEDLESTGFWDLFSETQALIFIEWPEKMNPADLPKDWNQKHISIGLDEGATSRRLYDLKA